MLIGVLQFELIVHGSQSLKDKRRVVRSVKDRLHRRHQVSVAEVAALDHPRLAVLGLAVVSNSTQRINRTMDLVIDKLRGLGDAELGVTSRQILHGQQLEGIDAESAIDKDALAAELMREANLLSTDGEDDS